jgi:replicative DNA helicase
MTRPAAISKKSKNASLAVVPVTDRVPPHNLDAEQGLLASCILDGGGDILSECLAKKLQPDYFFSAAHQLIFRAIVDLSMLGTGVDEITICEALRSNILWFANFPHKLNETTRGQPKSRAQACIVEN